MGIDAVMAIGILAWSPGPEGYTIRQDTKRFMAFLIVFLASAVGPVATMIDYSPTAIMGQLRNDPRLRERVSVHLGDATVGQVVESLNAHAALSIRLELDSALQMNDQKLGAIHTDNARAWSLMEYISRRQPVPARWQKVDSGYRLVKAAPMGLTLPWVLASLVLVAGSFILLRNCGGIALAAARNTRRGNVDLRASVGCKRIRGASP